jgi:hypothetical protein
MLPLLIGSLERPSGTGSSSGPGTMEQEPANFLGLRVPQIRRLVDLLGDDVMPVECAGHAGLLAPDDLA